MMACLLFSGQYIEFFFRLSCLSVYDASSCIQQEPKMLKTFFIQLLCLLSFCIITTHVDFPSIKNSILSPFSIFKPHTHTHIFLMNYFPNKTTLDRVFWTCLKKLDWCVCVCVRISGMSISSSFVYLIYQYAIKIFLHSKLVSTHPVHPTQKSSFELYFCLFLLVHILMSDLVLLLHTMPEKWRDLNSKIFSLFLVFDLAIVFKIIFYPRCHTRNLIHKTSLFSFFSFSL